MKNLLLIILLASSIVSISQTKTPNKVNVITTGCEVVEKASVNKGGKISEYKEMYLRCSVQDYYIKFCESKVSLKKMKKYLDQGVTVTYEVREGEWDICKGDPEMQSRIGTYAIVLKVKKRKSKGPQKKSGVRFL